MTTKKSLSETSLIDWVNSLSIPSCALVSSLDDLRDGRIVLEIAGMILKDPQAGSRRDPAENWKRILELLAKNIDEEFARFDPEALASETSDDYLIFILNFLLEYKENILSLERNALETSLEDKDMPSDSNESALTKMQEGILLWIQGLNIGPKENPKISKITGLCSSGVFLSELVNRLEGRAAPIRGINQNPQTKPQAASNVSKTLSYFRRLPKFRSRCLWSAEEIANENQEVIWNLLEDLREYYTVPIRKRASNSSVSSLTKSLALDKPPEGLEHPVKNSTFDLNLADISKSSRSYANVSKKSLKNSKSLSIIKQKDSNLLEIPRNVPRARVHEWLKALDVEFERNRLPLKDPLRNGVLLCELIRILEGERVQVVPFPTTLVAARANYTAALSILRKRKTAIPSSLIANIDAFTSDENVNWGLLYFLYTAYPLAVPLSYQPCELEYGAIELKQLENNIINWLVVLKIYKPRERPEFFSILPDIQSGLLLCGIVSRAIGKPIAGVFPSPITETTAINNIRKGLEILRLVPIMKQRFTWNERSIYRGTPSVILGLLFDIYTVYEESISPLSFAKTKQNGSEITGKTRKERNKVTLGSHLSLSEPGKNTGKNPYFYWLNRIGIPGSASIDFSRGSLIEFRSGVLLCDIISHVERVTIPFIDKHPKSKTSCIKNIQNGLRILSRRPIVPVDLLSCEEEVYNGDRKTILQLLNTLIDIWNEKAA